MSAEKTGQKKKTKAASSERVELARSDFDVTTGICNFAGELALVAGVSVDEGAAPSEILQWVEHLCYEVSNETLDGLQQQLSAQHENVEDLKTLWEAVSGAKKKVSEAQQFIEDLTGIVEDESLADLLKEVAMLDSHLTGDNEHLKMAVEKSLGKRQAKGSAFRESSVVEALLKSVVEDTPSGKDGLAAKIIELEQLCEEAAAIDEEIQGLDMQDEDLDEERLKTMGLICSQLDSPAAALSEAALTARLLTHMYEIEQIEMEFHAAQLRHQLWEKRIEEYKIELAAVEAGEEQQIEQSEDEEFIQEVQDELAKVEEKTDALMCPKCNSVKFVKNGFSGGKQRYRCKECNCRFTQSL